MKSFVRTKIIKGREYLYEITPYYDQEAGKWRQKTKYLGKNNNGEPVKKERTGKSGQIFNFGEYIPVYWAIKEHKIIEALLSSCSPEEAAFIVLLASNRLLDPCPPANLNTWLEGTYLSRLIPRVDFKHDNLMQVLQKISDRSVIEVFSRMFASINDLSDERVLYTLRLFDIPDLMREKGCRFSSKEDLEQELGVSIQYDPKKKILTGFDTFQLPHIAIKNSIERVRLGEIQGGIIVPHWDYHSSSLVSRLLDAQSPFIVRTDTSYGPVSSHVLDWSEQMDNPKNIKHFHGKSCYIQPFSVKFGMTRVPGFILHDIKKEQVDRLAFNKKIHQVRDLIRETPEYPGPVQEFLHETAGPFLKFFTIAENKGSYQIRMNQDEMNHTIKKFGRSCVLYQGNFTWEECFSLTDMRGILEQDMSHLILQLERDFQGYRIDRIRKGLFFICFLSILIQNLIMNRLLSAQIPEVFSFESLVTELKTIHIVKSYQPSVSPQRLTRKQKSLISFFGGIPPMKGD